VYDGERKLGEKEGPAGLTTGKFLFGAEILEVAMVGPNFKRFGVAFEVVAKGLKGTDNGKEFFIVNVIILFGIDQGLRVISDWVPTVKKVRLFKDCANGKITSVGDKTERTGTVRE
jgi:hypothetical protein